MITCLRAARHRGDPLLVAYVDAADLKVARYSGSPPAIEGSASTLVSGNVTCCAVSFGQSGRAYLTYCESGALKMRESDDQGATWGSPATVASGSWQWAGHAINEDLGLAVFMMRVDPAGGANTNWYSCCGSLGAGWSFTSPVVAIAGQASNRRRAPELYVLADGSIAANLHDGIYCCRMPNSGAADWGNGSEGADKIWNTFDAGAASAWVPDEPFDRCVYLNGATYASTPATFRWAPLVVSGSRGDEALGWDGYASADAITDGYVPAAEPPLLAAHMYGQLLAEPDGSFLLCYAESGGGIGFARCRCLNSADGTGTWS